MTRTAALAVIVLGLLAGASSAPAAAIIYYDDPGGATDGLLLANMLYNLVGHFDGDVRTAPAREYQAGDLAQFDHAFYIGSQSQTLPAALPAEAAAGDTPFFWIGGNIEQLMAVAGAPQQLGFQATAYDQGAGYDRVDYRGHVADRQGDLGFYQLAVTTAHAWATVWPSAGGGAARPYAVSGGGVFYFADVPFYYQDLDGRTFVLADLLHEFFQTGAPEQRRAMVRLEDLSAGLYDAPAVEAVAAALAARGVAFSFGVTPIFKDPTGVYYPAGTEIRLSDDPDFVALVHTLQSLGGVLVMHGVTHQHDDGLSISDWEFVTGEDFAPLPCDSAAWAEQRVQAGLAEFAAVDLQPVCWETPHYAASQGDYHVFGNHFRAGYERPLVFPVAADAAPVFGVALSPPGQPVPYFTPRGAADLGIIPDTLGYIDSQSANRSPADLLAAADRLTVVRDGLASFFGHAGVTPTAELLTVVDGLLERGYAFITPVDLLGDDDSGDDDASPDDDDQTDDDGADEASDDSADDGDGGCGC